MLAKQFLQERFTAMMLFASNRSKYCSGQSSCSDLLHRSIPKPVSQHIDHDCQGLRITVDGNTAGFSAIERFNTISSSDKRERFAYHRFLTRRNDNNWRQLSCLIFVLAHDFSFPLSDAPLQESERQRYGIDRFRADVVLSALSTASIVSTFANQQGQTERE